MDMRDDVKGQTIWVCPVHPEIRRNAPGHCPICGTALEPGMPEVQDRSRLKELSQRFWISVGLTFLLLSISLLDMLPGAPLSTRWGMQARIILQLILATPVCLWAAWPFYQLAWESLRRRRLTIHILFALTVSVAYLYSLVAALAPGIFPAALQVGEGQVPVYFEAAAVMVSLILLGQILKSKIRSQTNAISASFVPLVIAIALGTAIVWGVFGPAPRMSYALVNALAVLIIACPCALGLARPMSVMVAARRGAQMGIHFKNAAALELLKRVDTLVVDKTGTLTLGKPRLAQIITHSEITEHDLLTLVASLEQGHENPMATALVEAARDRGITTLPVQDLVVLAGKGIKGQVQNRSLALGSRNLMQDLGLDLEPLWPQAENLRGAGQTVMFLAIDGRLAGLVSVDDPIRDSARQAVKAMQDEGLRVIMLSGDSRTTAQAIGRKLALDDVAAELTPEQKVQFISQLQAKGQIVAMAGNRIHDAPALAKANLGVAMGTGTEVAVENAGVTLVKDDLMGFVKALKLSQATFRNIRQNLFFAFAYNAAAIPIAAGILYPFFQQLLSPMIAAAAMSLSSFSVMANALRLKMMRVA